MKRSYHERRLGNIEALEIAGDGPTIILCHGYGADAYDLLPLHEVLEAPSNARWIFPQAPLELVQMRSAGRAWFEIDIEALNFALSTGSHRHMADAVPAGLDHAREELLEMQNHLGVPWNQIVIGGFSQGAMISTEVVMSLSEKPLGLMILSGTLINEQSWRNSATKQAGLKFFQSHGKSDPLLDFKDAQKLEKLLVGAGLRGQLLPFQGGHEIPMDVIKSLSNYIRKVTSNS